MSQPRSAVTDTPRSTAKRPAARKYRPELQGVRALAATLVVLYHVWFNRVSGGVDIFFLISGFLITGQLVRAASSEKGIQFRAMWGRMFKRLLPAALTVLIVSMAVSAVILPQDRWLQTIKEVVASALYYENWQLAADSVNYFARHNTQSVAQHYWSLSLQGQFYVVWPILILGVAFLARKLKRRLPGMVAITMTVLFFGSIAYSIYLTNVDQPYAYFNSFTRVWEFALGGLLALFIDVVVLPRSVRVLLGWVGIAGIISCGLLVDVSSTFPGYIALWPTGSAALVILAGATETKFAADRFLSSKPFEYLGNISYSLYLWHWPVMLFWLVGMNRGEIGFRGGVLLIGISLALAVLTYHFIEKPVRFSQIGMQNRWGAYRFAVIVLAVTLGMAGAWQAFSAQKVDTYRLVDVNDPSYPGAKAQDPGFTYQGDKNPQIRPSLIALPNDWAIVTNRKCVISPLDKELSMCSNPVKKTPAKRIVVVGDSHIQQWIAPLNQIAAQHNWQITSMLKGACPFSTKSEDAPADQSCVDFNRAATREIQKMHPDAVFTLASRNVRTGLTENTPPGFVQEWSELEKSQIPVLALRDTPRFSFSPPACIQAKSVTDPSCGAMRSRYLPPVAPYEKIPAKPDNVHFLDFSNYLCTDTYCPPVIGNVYVYLDDNHPSATYLRTMTPVVQRAIDNAMHW